MKGHALQSPQTLGWNSEESFSCHRLAVIEIREISFYSKKGGFNWVYLQDSCFRSKSILTKEQSSCKEVSLSRKLSKPAVLWCVTDKKYLLRLLNVLRLSTFRSILLWRHIVEQHGASRNLHWLRYSTG